MSTSIWANALAMKRSFSNMMGAQMFHQPKCSSSPILVGAGSRPIRSNVCSRSDFSTKHPDSFLIEAAHRQTMRACSVWHWFTIHKHFKHWFNFQKQIKNICVASINISNIGLLFKNISNIDLPFGLASTNISSVFPFYVFYPQEMHLGPKLPNIFSKSN